MEIPNDSKLLAKSALKALGGNPVIHKYWDDDEVGNIDILSTVDRPWEGITSYATLGLYMHSIGKIVDGKFLRVEIVGASATSHKKFSNILATCAFCIINSKMPIYPGAIFNDVVKMYYPDIDMKHMLFVPPFLWEEQLQTIDSLDKKVAWLLAVPISENEYLFAQEYGSNKLEDLFEQKQIDIFDIERKSVL
ncbi:suppressor of fused domain protein [Paenibacillus sp. JJ-223]|uniref:suppressor of fused domain protein n=1 Tax=Paenibacillus sp. JJ-223 TaxID=2905647 RepID=UPI001F1B782B|nr:suppressor of fused domain protein [Paenibacillus sp. JJ-223]CAH1225037.1 Antitoxin YqcF [Paenibacillus sp. JJ-223]